MAVNVKKDYGSTRNRKPDITNLVYGKVPPQATEMERAVLGALMLEKDCIPLVMGIIKTADCFYVDAHQKIYTVIQRLYDGGMPVDLFMVTEAIVKAGHLDAIGGAYYLTELTSDVVTSAHVEAHALVIVEKFLKREMIRYAGCIIRDAYEETTDALDLIELSQTDLYKISNNIGSGEVEHISQIIPEVLSESEDLRGNDKEITGVPTKILAIDKLTLGWQNSDFIVLAARPAVGKTAFSLNIALGAAQEGFATALFSLEMSKAQLVKRLIADYSSTEAEKIRSPHRMSDNEWAAFVKESLNLGKLPIYIDDKASITVSEIRSKAFSLKTKHDIKLLIVDYLQLVQSSVSGNENDRLTQISRDLKVLAKDLNIPVIALSQLNREAKGIPTVSQLRGSGAIEQDADIVILMYHGDAKDMQNIVMVEFPKFRNGATDKVVLEFDKTYQRFKEKKDTVSTPQSIQVGDSTFRPLPKDYFKD